MNAENGQEGIRGQLRTAPCPGIGSDPYVAIVRAFGRGVTRGYFISDSVWGVLLHWHHLVKRLTPCYRNPADCEHCKKGSPTQWKGYIAGAIWPRRSRRVVEIPEGAYRACAELQKQDGRLRGFWFSLKRFPGPTNNAPVSIEIAPGAPVSDLEKPWDVLTTLLGLWGLRDLDRRKIAAQGLAERLDDRQDES